ncbi:MAG: hypothetical protein O3C21_16670 [Verrucomicrobia bacterium]|nr:hypothetical protein [Verrucomicrobiota bacterium]
MTETTTDSDVEWLRIKRAVHMSSIGRSTLYELMNDGLIKSRRIRRPGNTKGIVLISAESLRQFIENSDAS